MIIFLDALMFYHGMTNGEQLYPEKLTGTKKRTTSIGIPVPKKPEKFHTRTRYEKMRTWGEKMRRWYENKVRENPETGQVFFEKP